MSRSNGIARGGMWDQAANVLVIATALGRRYLTIEATDLPSAAGSLPDGHGGNPGYEPRNSQKGWRHEAAPVHGLPDLNVCAQDRVRFLQDATPAAGRISVKGRAGLGYSRELLRQWQRMRASERIPLFFFPFWPPRFWAPGQRPAGPPSMGEVVGDCITAHLRAGAFGLRSVVNRSIRWWTC